MKGARILLVEDNADLADGPAGLDDARHWSPDLILLDLMLPGMSGFQVLEALRTGGHRVPVIIVSARGEEADKVRGFRLDADQYVTKPVGLLELLERAAALLRRSARDGAAPATTL